jgi:hypothetical protein
VWKESQLNHLERHSEASINFQNFPFWGAKRTINFFRKKIKIKENKKD